MKSFAPRTFPLWLAVAAALAWHADLRAQGGPVKVKIENESAVVGEGASLPIDPTPKVRFGYQPNNMMPGLGGLNNERLTISPQGGHDMMLQIDGQICIIGQQNGKWQTQAKPLGKTPGGKQRVGVTSTWVTSQNVHVTQVIELIPSKTPPKGSTKRQMDVMLLKYTFENKDTKAHSVGLRNTIDIYLINNDGALFASPLTHPGVIVNGHEFKGDKLPEYVQVIQNNNLQNPGYITHFSFKLGKLEPPTRFVCTNLGACFQGGFDVPAQPAGDSAVAIFFDPKPLQPGGKREMAYAYGIGVASNPENEGRVNLELGGSFEPGHEFTITAYINDPLESQALTLELPAGLELIQGRVTQPVPPADDTGSSVVLWKARVAKLGSHTFKIRSSNGVEYKTKLTIEEAPKGTKTSQLVQPLGEAPAPAVVKGQPENQPAGLAVVAKLAAQGNKAALLYIQRQRMIQDQVDGLRKAEQQLKESNQRVEEVAAALKEQIAKLGAQDPKVKALAEQVAKGQEQAAKLRQVVALRNEELRRLQAENEELLLELQKSLPPPNPPGGLPPVKLQAAVKRGAVGTALPAEIAKYKAKCDALALDGEKTQLLLKERELEESEPGQPLPARRLRTADLCLDPVAVTMFLPPRRVQYREDFIS
jgi:hypothetical protein